MAYTSTPNLRLRVESTLSDTARYNLYKIDELGAVFYLDATATATIRSALSLILRPNDPSVGGSGIGGTIHAGTESQPLDQFIFHANTVDLSEVSNFKLGANTTIEGSFQVPWQNVILTEASILDFPDAAELFANVDADFGSNQITTSGGVNFARGSRSVSLVPPPYLDASYTLTLPPNDGEYNQVLTTDGNGTLSWKTVEIVGTGAEVYFWTTGQGTTRTIVHGLATSSIDVTVKDTETNELIYVSQIIILDDNTLTLISSEPPTTTWKVILQGA